MNIEQHKYDVSFLTDRADKSRVTYLPIHKKFLNDDLYRLQFLADDCTILTAYYSIIEPEPYKAVAYFLIDQRAMKWYFKMAMLPEGIIEKIVLNEEWQFTIEAIKTRDYINSTSWINTLYEAVIARDKEAIEWLVQFPTDRMRKATAISPEYSYLYVDFLKAYFTWQADFSQKLVATYKATDPSMMWEEYLDTMFKKDTPVLDVWIAFLKNDQVEFNQRLEKALILYREYCAADPKSIYTLINYPLTALAAMAHDRGWNITVTSGYMPEWMIRGEFT